MHLWIGGCGPQAEITQRVRLRRHMVYNGIYLGSKGFSYTYLKAQLSTTYLHGHFGGDNGSKECLGLTDNTPRTSKKNMRYFS